MSGLVAFDPFNSALRRSSYALGQADQRSRWESAARLVRFYEGNQAPYLQQYIAALFKSPQLQQRYGALASWSNVTRWIIDRVTALGGDPVQISWGDENDDALWDEVAYQHCDLDLFVSTWAKYTELCKTDVALVSWDNREKCLRLGHYTPNVIHVAYSDEDIHPTCPDLYRILENESGREGEEWQTWDFSQDVDENGDVITPRVPTIYEEIGNGGDYRAAGSDVETWEVVDPLTGRPLIPFVALRTGHAAREYFLDDGQMELIDGQEAINRTWTQIFANLHGSAFKIAVLTGPGWAGKNGKDVALTADTSEAIVCPMDPTSTIQPGIEWKSAYDAAITTSLLEVIDAKRKDMAQTFHFDAAAVTSSAEIASGVALWIRNQALRQKLTHTRMLAQKPLQQLVWAMAVIWNHYSVDKRKFSLKARPTIKIPDPSFQMDPETELRIDAQKLDLGAMSKKTFVQKWNPDMTPAEVDALLAEKVALPPNSQQGGISRLFKAKGLIDPNMPTPMNPTTPAAPGNSQNATAAPMAKGKP